MQGSDVPAATADIVIKPGAGLQNATHAPDILMMREVIAIGRVPIIAVPNKLEITSKTLWEIPILSIWGFILDPVYV